MQKQIAEFAVEKKNGVVQKIGKFEVVHPKVKYEDNDGIKWYEDKPKKKIK